LFNSGFLSVSNKNYNNSVICPTDTISKLLDVGRQRNKRLGKSFLMRKKCLAINIFKKQSTKTINKTL